MASLFAYKNCVNLDFPDWFEKKGALRHIEGLNYQNSFKIANFEGCSKKPPAALLLSPGLENFQESSISKKKSGK